MFKHPHQMAAILLTAGLIWSCDGRHEDAGERADARNGLTGGESSIVAGPAEKAGEQKDLEESRRRAGNYDHD
jgi:hypothetical protein